MVAPPPPRQCRQWNAGLSSVGILEGGFVVLPAMEHTQDGDCRGPGVHPEGDVRPAPEGCHAQPWQQVVALVAPLRERRQALAKGDEVIDVTRGGAGRSGK